MADRKQILSYMLKVRTSTLNAYENERCNGNVVVKWSALKRALS